MDAVQAGHPHAPRSEEAQVVIAHVVMFAPPKDLAPTVIAPSGMTPQALMIEAFDEVAGRGVLFTNAISGSPGCAPSRAAMLTGRPPFHSENPVEAILQVIEREPPLPRSLQPTVPQELEWICLKCLEKDPQRR